MTSKPVWTEGLLLSQHHLQQQDRYHEDLLRTCLRAVTHYGWGILDLRVDESGFAAGQFKLQRLRAIWPDGTVVACGEGTDVAVPPPRALPADVLRVEVFLGLAHDVDGAGIVGGAEEATVRRYVRATRPVVDVNTGGAAQEIEWARPNLRVFFNDERRDGFACLCVAIILRQENGTFAIQDTYVPPTLNLRAAPFLETGLRRVLTSVMARQQQLAGERRQRQSGAVDFHATEVRKFWLLHTLNGVIPRLNHLLETPDTHPEEAYCALAELAGELCSFAAEADPATVVPKFSFLDLGDVFERLFATVLRLLPGGIERAFVEIGLERRPDGMFIGKFADPSLLTHELFIAVQSPMAEALVRDRVPQLLKIASWSQIYDVVKQARFGVRVELDWNPTNALPIKPGVCFFRLQKEGPYWEDMAHSATLALYLPLDGQWSGTTLAMYGVPPGLAR